MIIGAGAHRPLMKLGVIFATPLVGGGMILSDEFKRFYEDHVKRIKSILEERFPDVEFVYGEAGTASDSIRVLREIGGVDGYLVFVFRHLTGVLRPIIMSGRPTVILAETYTGSGELMMEYRRIVEGGLRVLGRCARKVADPKLIEKYVKLLKAVYDIGNSKLLLVVDPVVSQYVDASFPMAVGIYNAAAEVRSIFGIETITITPKEFNEMFYEKVSEEEARNVARRWMREARSVVGHEESDLIGDAKMYLAMRRAVEHYGVDGIAVDCWTLHSSGMIEAWPCLGFMELSKEGVVCGCEADLTSSAIMILMKHLAGLPGFITDPSIDEVSGEVVYYHCFSPINMLGYDSKKYSPYVITTAHWGGKKGSIYVELPSGRKVTLVGLNAVDRCLVVHEAEIVGNEYDEKECSTKPVGRAKVGNLLRNWDWKAGWHRVMFYGEWKEALREIGALLGLRVVEEDAGPR